MNTVKLGLELAQTRREVGLTQVVLAQKLGTTQSAISKLESGRSVPSIQFLDRFAKATGRPIQIVLTPDDEAPSRQEQRERIQRVLGDYEFNPWDRNPTAAEARSLERDGLTRDRFQSKRTAGPRRS